jgi:thioredoxin reductase
MDQNEVVLTYRGEAFQRIKPKNSDKINKAVAAGKIEVIFSSNIEIIEENTVTLILQGNEKKTIANDLVYIFAGGELPTQFLQKAGIEITTRFGHALLKHEKKR